MIISHVFQDENGEIHFVGLFRLKHVAGNIKFGSLGMYFIKFGLSLICLFWLRFARQVLLIKVNKRTSKGGYLYTG